MPVYLPCRRSPSHSLGGGVGSLNRVVWSQGVARSARGDHSDGTGGGQSPASYTLLQARPSSSVKSPWDGAGAPVAAASLRGVYWSLEGESSSQALSLMFRTPDREPLGKTAKAAFERELRWCTGV